ncbi:MAG: hypothetical protein WC350_00865 [Candidatus Micrarchaeia archaeon]|jgi:hypothetical protein
MSNAAAATRERAIAFAMRKGETPFAKAFMELPPERMGEAARLFRFLEKKNAEDPRRNLSPLKYLLALAVESARERVAFCLAGDFAKFAYVAMAEGGVKGPVERIGGSPQLSVIDVDGDLTVLAELLFGGNVIKDRFSADAKVCAFDEHAGTACQIQIFGFKDGILDIDGQKMARGDLRTHTMDVVGVGLPVLSLGQLVRLKLSGGNMGRLDALNLVCALRMAQKAGRSGDMGGTLQEQLGKLDLQEKNMLRVALMQAAKGANGHFGGLVPYYGQPEIESTCRQVEGICLSF